jgi:hypothetical protein
MKKGHLGTLGIVLSALLPSCGDDQAQPEGDASTTGASTTVPGDTLETSTGTPASDSSGTTVALDDTGTSSGSTTSESTTSGSSSSTDGTSDATTGGCGLMCPALCGNPAACCAGDQECVGGSCVAACASGIRCGAALDQCCADGQLCLGGACADPLGTCIDGFDCAADQFCEPTRDECFLQPAPPHCEVSPSFTDLDVTLEWSLEADQITSMPAVADVDGDGQPEVIVSTIYATDPDGTSLEFYGEIVVLDGADGTEQLRVQDQPAADSWGSYSRSTVGIADVDGNGVADVVYVGRPEVNIAPFANNSSIIHAVDGFGQHLWASHAPDGTPHYVYVRHGAPAFANFDDDDASEIVFGTAVLDHDGTVVFDQDNTWGRGGGVFGSNGDYLGGISAIVDLTGDGYPEIVSGNQAWTVTWNQPAMGPPNVVLTPLWEHLGPDGYPAVADLDQDGDPEVVLVADPLPYNVLDGTVRVLDGATGELWCGIDPTDALCQVDPSLRTQPIAIPGGGRGGPPTVADFDGDGRLEIAVAGGVSFAVYDLARMGEVVVQPVGDPPAQAGDVFVRWSSPVQDGSSSGTGVSAFDFQGDGISEVLYGDECHLRVYRGDDGTIMLEQQSSGYTIHEYPVVADVDDDGSSELLVVSADGGAPVDCTDAGFVARRGLFVYGGLDPWVRTREVWNTHAYHVTNATGDGRVPALESPSWTDPDTHGYRRAPAQSGSLYAPDLRVDLVVDASNSESGEIVIQAIVHNFGTQSVPAGVEVVLYEGIDATGTELGASPTTEILVAGASTMVSWVQPAPLAATAFFATLDSAPPQCDATNDGSVVAPVSCD